MFLWKQVVVLVIQEQHHYQKDWRSIHHSLNWTWDWVYYWIWLIDFYSITFHLYQCWRIRSNIIIRSIEGQFIPHSIGPVGLSLLLNMIDWSLFNHIPFLTILVHQEQHHYQKHWRSIHHSLNWTWKWVYYWTWLIVFEWHPI